MAHHHTQRRHSDSTTQSIKPPHGDVAQLGEHLLCKEGVRSSSLLISTKSSTLLSHYPYVDALLEKVRHRRREHASDAMANDHPGDTTPPTDIELSVKALESLLVEKGLLDPEAVDALLELHGTEIGPSNGKRVVAKAWADEEFKRWLLADPNAAIASLGYVSSQGELLRVVENTDDVHNLVVCTLCSCYPWPLLGLPPVWYKTAPYRAQAVADPRGVMRQFGAEIGSEKEVRVWDSTSEMRYLVLSQRPPDTEGWSEEKLCGLVTRNAMIGVEEARRPVTMGTL